MNPNVTAELRRQHRQNGFCPRCDVGANAFELVEDGMTGRGRALTYVKCSNCGLRSPSQ